MLGDKSHHGSGTAGASKWVNFISILGIVGCQIYLLVKVSGVIGSSFWAPFVIGNSWLILNIIFHFLPHNALITFLKCRVCLVYVLFALQLLVDIIVLIVVALAGAVGFVATSAVNSVS